jgi:4-amino-4-deoxy-L-arabinose transferase-like glycosyltransferase
VAIGSAVTSWRARIAATAPADLAGTALGLVAVGIAFAVAVVGIGGPFPEGHYASSAAIGTGAANMWRWHTIYPVTKWIDHAPMNSDYYMHHPLGVFWTVALLGKLLTFSNWVLRLPPLIYVTATTWLLWRLARELWGAIPGGLAALAYVALPITLGYANYHDLEQPVMFGCVLSTWGYVRLVRTGRERYTLASVFGFAFALNHDWPAYIWGAFFLGGLFVYGFLIPQGARRPLRPLAFGRYWAAMCVAAAFSIALELYLLKGSGRISDMMASYFTRTAGSETPLENLLVARHYRIALMFTGLAIAIGKLALPVIVIRAVVKSDHFELLSLPLFLCAMLQYTSFKQGADVHIFWPHYFATYFALAAGALAASIIELAIWIGDHVRGGAQRFTVRRVAPWAALAVVGLPLALVLKDGLSLVRLARESGGRFAEANLDSDIERTVALRWFLARFPETVGVGYHPSVPANWAVQWETRPHIASANQPISNPGGDRTRVYILDTRSTSLADIRYAVSHYHVHAIGSLWLMDRTEPPGPIEGYAMDEREPSWWQWLWLGPVEPVRSVRWSPWVTWEWRLLLGQPAAAPQGTPATIDEVRIAHNAALERHDEKTAAALRARLQAAIDLPRTVAFDGDTTLLGAIHHHGARRSLTLFFVAGKFDADSHFKVHAKVLRPPRLSTLPADPADLELASGPIWPTTLWRKGHIYRFDVVYRKRPGTEVLTATWSPGPKRVDDARGPLELIRL